MLYREGTMAVRKGPVGFCLHPSSHNIRVPRTSQFFGTAVSPQSKFQPPLFERVSFAQDAPSMSLTNDLIIKGLEVGVATFLGNAVAVQQQSSRQKFSKRGFFRSRSKKGRSETTAPTRGVAPSQVRGMVAELVRLAEEVPKVLERGGPEGKKWVKLAICIGIDLVGSGSLGVPLLGDALDLVTAPISAVMLQALFGNTLVTMGGLAEELLPGTDGIPTATLAWLAEYHGCLTAEKDGKTG